MKQLNDCPNVVSCQDVEAIQKDNGYGWDILIRMELLTPLKSYLLQQQDFPEAEVIRLGREMANALVACGKCRSVCHMGVDPARNPGAAECIRCGECVAACPEQALSLGFSIKCHEKKTSL